jgi:hypothetical protein
MGCESDIVSELAMLAGQLYGLYHFTTLFMSNPMKNTDCD